MRSLNVTRRTTLASLAGLTASAGCIGSTGSDDATSSTPEPTYGETDSPWPMLGHDRRNTGSTGVTVPDGPLAKRRVFRVGKDDRTDAPIYANGNVLLARSETSSLIGGAFALAPDTGEQQWHNPDVMDYTTPSVYGETVIFSGNGHTFAVGVETGTVHWHRELGGSGFYKTHLKRDDLLVVGAGRHVVALDAYTGETRWRSPELGVPFGLAADDDRIYVTVGDDDESALHALDWRSGESTWQVDGVAPVRYPVASGDRVLHTDVATGTLHAFDAASGETLWTYETEDADAPPSVSPGGDRAYLTGIDEPQVHVLSVEDGSREWRVDGHSARQPLVTGDAVFLAGYDTVERVSRSRRQVTDSIQLQGEITSPLSLGPDGLFLVARTASGTYFAHELVAEPAEG